MTTESLREHILRGISMILEAPLARRLLLGEQKRLLRAQYRFWQEDLLNSQLHRLLRYYEQEPARMDDEPKGS